MIRMIIVDDEITTRKGLKECIAWNDVGIDEVFEAEDGLKAMELAQHFRPDIVLTDVRMPRMNGIELAEKLKETFPFCKVVFLSGFSDKEYLLSAISLQAINYIEKPVDPNEVREVIKKTVTICLKEREKLIQSKENLCLEIIRHKSGTVELRDRLKSVDMNIPEDMTVTCVLMKLNSFSGGDPPASVVIKDKLFETLEKQINQFAAGFLYTIKDRDFIILLVFGNYQHVKKDLLKVLTGLQDEIKTLLPDQKGVSMGIGKSVLPENAVESYQTAFLAVRKEFYLGYGLIHFFYEDPGEAFDFNKLDAQTFINHIHSNNKAQAIFLIKSTANELKQHPNTLVNNIRNYFFNILSQLSRLAEDRGIRLRDPANREFFWDVISRLSTISEIENYILEKMEDYFKALEEKESRNSIVFNIMNYIKDHYADMDLSIKTLSCHTYLTPNYLCLLFKRETEKTINQYITEIRIENAKELLKNRQVKLYEVSTRVGFGDPNYFAKIFKKSEGMNPSEYREKYFA